MMGVSLNRLLCSKLCSGALPIVCDCSHALPAIVNWPRQTLAVMNI